MDDNRTTRERIAAFQAAYIRAIDTDRLEEWPQFFAERCMYRVTNAENERAGLPAGLIWADSRAMLADRVLALRRANVYERHAYRHIVGLPAVLSVNGDTADAETPFIVARIMHDGQTDLFATGVYRDCFDLSGAEALLRTRIVVCDSTRIDTLLAIPL